MANAILEVVSRKKVLYPLLAILIIAIGSAIMFALLRPRDQISGPERCRIQECGKSGPKYTDAHGTAARNALEDQLPFHVAVSNKYLNSSIICVGNLINDRWILTSANCLSPSKGNIWIPEAIRVAVGIVNVNDFAANSIKIENYWLHPEFNHDSMVNNIALIKTAAALNKTERFVSPICLPFDDPVQKDQSVQGTTFTSSKKDGPGLADLQVIEMKTNTDGEGCLESSTDDVDIFCSTTADDSTNFPHKDVCSRDIGSPMIFKNKDGSYILKALAASPISCGKKIASYTRVYKHLDWTCDTMIDHGLE